MAIAIQGVDHIMITVGDLDIAKDFYESVLGLQEADCPVKDGMRVWYKLGNQELHVNLRRDFCAGKGHFALSVKPEQYHQYYEQVKNSGYAKITESMHFSEDNHHRFYLDDPFGNFIEVIDGSICA